MATEVKDVVARLLGEWSDDWSAAPRDGREVLLRLHNGGIHIAQWSTSYSVFGLGGCWTDGLSTMGDKIDYSHWRPIDDLRELLWALGKSFTAAEGRVALLEEERDTRSEGWSAFLTENAGNISDLNDQVRTLSSALELQVEQAFRDGLAYATNVKPARPEEHDIAWLQSQARARLAKGGQ